MTSLSHITLLDFFEFPVEHARISTSLLPDQKKHLKNNDKNHIFKLASSKNPKKCGRKNTKKLDMLEFLPGIQFCR